MFFFWRRGAFKAQDSVFKHNFDESRRAGGELDLTRDETASHKWSGWAGRHPVLRLRVGGTHRLTG